LKLVKFGLLHYLDLATLLEEDEEGAIKIAAVWAEYGRHVRVGSSESACFLMFFSVGVL